MRNPLNILACAVLLSLQACGQTETPVAPVEKAQPAFVQIAEGISWCEIQAPDSSVVGDSKLTILKLDPKVLDFGLFTASNRDRKPMTADRWADSLGLCIVFNAGMYDLSKPLVSRGYLKNGAHYNQGMVKEGWNSAIAIDPADTNAHDIRIFDIQQKPVTALKNSYGAIAQGLRMLDSSGGPTYWKKRVQSCSMLVAAEDDAHNFYLIFTRSPYTHNTMIDFMHHRLPLKLKNAIYLEGGPETSLYVKAGDFELRRVGSYVSQTYENDRNDHFWPLPNVIGVKLK
jgi:hypothetical protein